MAPSETAWRRRGSSVKTSPVLGDITVIEKDKADRIPNGNDGNNWLVVNDG